MNQAHKDMGLPNKRMTDGTGGKLGDPAKGEIKPRQSSSPVPPKPTATPGKTAPPPSSPDKLPPPPPPTITPTGALVARKPQ